MLFKLNSTFTLEFNIEQWQGDMSITILYDQFLLRSVQQKKYCIVAVEGFELWTSGSVFHYGHATSIYREVSVAQWFSADLQYRRMWVQFP